ncbi:hypothetical protein QZH56_09235 [Streptomyces olivoreticuli]|uniref:hypothetical protein n=1 Tax=Streptomyces olivoreticuli TaxID=68246 RepID=UPI0026594A60|nr:hypothetical protein [Streptomyces olivoreticuli]WKK25751.1 hypothetical protein QZH56_09235 [Streptomyces olivoreticuli]
MKARSAIVRTLGAASAGALAWLAATSGTSAASSQDGATVQAATGDTPGYAVEDFGYPEADKILADKGITLKRGDGHILLADCADATGLIQIIARNKSKVCFRVTGDSGYLALEIPAVHSIRGNDYAARVDMTVGSERKTFDISKNIWTPVGESGDPQGREHTLVEIRTSK